MCPGWSLEYTWLLTRRAVTQTLCPRLNFSTITSWLPEALQP